MMIDVDDEDIPRTDFMKYSNTDLCPMFVLQRPDAEGKIYKLNAHLIVKDIFAFVDLMEKGIKFKPPSLNFINVDTIDEKNKLVSCMAQYFEYVNEKSMDNEQIKSVRNVIREQLSEKEYKKIFKNENSKTCCCS